MPKEIKLTNVPPMNAPPVEWYINSNINSTIGTDNAYSLDDDFTKPKSCYVRTVGGYVGKISLRNEEDVPEEGFLKCDGEWHSTHKYPMLVERIEYLVTRGDHLSYEYKRRGNSFSIRR